MSDKKILQEIIKHIKTLRIVESYLDFNKVYPLPHELLLISLKLTKTSPLMVSVGDTLMRRRSTSHDGDNQSDKIYC